MNIILVITILIFFLLLYINYGVEGVGRIERKNKITGEYQDLGPVSEKEEIAFLEGHT